MNIKIFKIILSVIICFSVIFSNTSTSHAYKGSSEMKTYLKHFKSKNIKKIVKSIKKMKEFSEDTSLKKMSKKNKKAYLKKVKSFEKKYKEYTEYYLADMNKDRHPELILRYDPCAAGGETYFYTYKKGKVKKVGKIFSSQTWFCTYPGKGVVQRLGHMGYYEVNLYTVKKGKLKKKSYGSINVDNVHIKTQHELFPNMILSGHVKYKKNKRFLDYTPLK